VSPFPAGRRYFPLAPAIFFAGLASAVAAAHTEVNALIVLDVPDPAAARAVLGNLKARGVIPAHFLPPDTVLAHIPPGLDGILLGEKGVAAVYRNDAPPEKGTGRGTGVWNRNFSPAGRGSRRPRPR
jgi:hypothetical protein